MDGSGCNMICFLSLSTTTYTQNSKEERDRKTRKFLSVYRYRISRSASQEKKQKRNLSQGEIRYKNNTVFCCDRKQNRPVLLLTLDIAEISIMSLRSDTMSARGIGSPGWLASL